MSSRSERNNQRVRDCKESFKRMRMKFLQSERLDRAREQMRQKARELKKRGQAVASAAAENPRLQRLKKAMQRKRDEEEAAKNAGPTDEEKLFNDRMYYDFMKEQKEARKRAELKTLETQARLGAVTITRAAELGNTAIIERLMDEGEGKTPEPDHLFTPLHAACARGKLHTVQYLVQDAKADVEARDKYGCTPVVRAAANGHMNVVKWLTETPLVDASIHTPSYWKATALHFASQFGHIRMCEYLLLRKNMDVLAQTDALLTPYQVVASGVRGEEKNDIEEKLRRMFHPHVEMKKNELVATLGSALNGVTAEEAAMTHQINIAKTVGDLHLEWEDDQLADIREYENNVQILFQFTREGKRVALDDFFADPKMTEIADDIRDEKHGRSLLHIAAVDGDCDIAEVILDSTFLTPLDVDAKGRNGLHLAALYGHVGMVELMLDNASPPGPEGWEKLTSATDGNGKTAAELLLQRWKPSFRDGAKQPPASIIRAEKIRIRTDLEYLLDPEREGRELEESKLLETYETQVLLTQTYHETGMKAPKWIRNNANHINAKLGGMRARQRKIESRKKQKILLEERIKEREAMTRRELIALSHNSKKMRGALRKKLDKIEYVQGTKIAWSEARQAELEPELKLAQAKIGKENRFLELCHVRVAAIANRFVSGDVSFMQSQVDSWQKELNEEAQKEQQYKDEWVAKDDAAKRKIVDAAANNQLEIRFEACRERYEEQLQKMNVAALALQAGLVPDATILERKKRQLKTGTKINWKKTRRKGQNFMNAGKTIVDTITEKEMKKIAAEAMEIKYMLDKDTKKLKHDREMMVNKQHAWDLRTAHLEYDFADDHIGRRTQEMKRNVHRSHHVKITVLEKQLKAEEKKIDNIKKKLGSEINYREYDVKMKWLDVKYIGKWTNALARMFCYRWDIKACNAMVLNLEEDLFVVEKKVVAIKEEINDLRDEELVKMVDLNREAKEMLAMVRIDVGEDILSADIEDAIELPYVSDSDSGEGSAWDSDDDRVDGEENDGESSVVSDGDDDSDS